MLQILAIKPYFGYTTILIRKKQDRSMKAKSLKIKQGGGKIKARAIESKKQYHRFEVYLQEWEKR